MIWRVDVLIELRAVAAECVDEHIRTDELVLGHLDRARAGVVRRVGLERRRVLDPNRQFRGHRCRSSFTPSNDHRPSCCRRRPSPSSPRPGRRAKHQRQRRRCAGVGIQLRDVGHHVDRASSRAFAPRRMQSRDDEVRAEHRRRGTPQDTRSRRLRSRTCSWTMTAVPRSSEAISTVALPSVAATAFKLRTRRAALRRARGCEQTDRDVLDRAGIRSVRQRDRDVAAGGSREGRRPARRRRRRLQSRRSLCRPRRGLHVPTQQSAATFLQLVCITCSFRMG